MGDKKPANYPVNHNEAAIENNSKNVQTNMQQVSVPLHLVFKSLKDSGMSEEDIYETVFRLGLNIGKLV
jgi:hypothetical protein